MPGGGPPGQRSSEQTAFRGVIQATVSSAPCESQAAPPTSPRAAGLWGVWRELVMNWILFWIAGYPGPGVEGVLGGSERWRLEAGHDSEVTSQTTLGARSPEPRLWRRQRWGTRASPPSARPALRSWVGVRRASGPVVSAPGFSVSPVSRSNVATALGAVDGHTGGRRRQRTPGQELPPG